MAYAYGVEYDENEGLLELTPGKYWIVTEGSDVGDSAWNSYRKALKSRFGKSSFRTVQTRESQTEGETWVVIDVATTIYVDPNKVVGVSSWDAGDTPETEGQWVQQPPSWIHTATDIIETIEDKAGSITLGFERIAYAGAALGLVYMLMNRRKR